jgi:thioredoxin reductase
VRKVLGPAPGWFIKDRIIGKVPFHLGVEITQAAINEKGRLELSLTNAVGHTKTIDVDHVIAATGYRVDLKRLPFLGLDLRHQIRLVENSPILSANFESSIPGLYFVGVASASTFGPLMRFACGAGFVAARLAEHFNKMQRHVTAFQAADKAEAYERG